MIKYRFDQFEFSNQDRTEFFKGYMSPLPVQIVWDQSSSDINVQRSDLLMNRTVPDFKFTTFNRRFITSWFIKLAFNWINFFSNRSGWSSYISTKLFSIIWTACMIVFKRFTWTPRQKRSEDHLANNVTSFELANYFFTWRTQTAGELLLVYPLISSIMIHSCEESR